MNSKKPSQEANQIQIEKVFDNLMKLPPEQREIVVSRFTAVQETYSGPLPHPELLERYDKIISEGAERIMRMAESEQMHRHKCDDLMIKGEVALAKRGQIVGALLAILITCAGFWLTLTGHEVVGSVVFGTTIIGVISVFVTYYKKQKK